MNVIPQIETQHFDISEADAKFSYTTPSTILGIWISFVLNSTSH